MKKRAASIAAAALITAGAVVSANLKPKPQRHFPLGLCWKRPAGAPVESCLMVLPDAGRRNQGDENVLRPGEPFGDGCVETTCGVMQGEKP